MQIRSARFEVNKPGSSGFAFGEADAWRILITVDATPRAYVMLADPGNTDDPRLTALALRRAGEIGDVYERAAANVAERMGVSYAPRRRPTCSVVLCTHRRPQFVALALAAIKSLDPPADEVIVVDNAPGELDCQVICELAGVRYVREERRGQDWSRAAGLAHATSELVAFTDDDVIVAPGWLRPLAELFAADSVGAVTGVAVAHDLETPAQDLRESFAGFVPGMHRHTFDWTNLRPVSSGAAGAGANMIFRRRLLLELGEVFPVELDGGTPTRSGGDLYTLYRVLAAGRRIAFDPGVYAEHRHARDYEALRDTIRGYGTGFAAFLTKALVERREATAPLAWMWLVSRLAEALVREPLAPYPGLVALRFEYLRGGLAGPRAWVQSRRSQQRRRPPFDLVNLATARAVGVDASPLSRAALAGATDGIEAALPQRRDLDTAELAGAPRVIEVCAQSTLARNRAAREALSTSGGALLLFLDPACTPSPGLAASHAARHSAAATDRIVIGRTVVRAGSESLAAQVAAFWCQDRFDARRDTAALTFADLPSGNISLPAALFERLGGFDERLEPQAAAHEFAIRALQSGIELEYEPNASVEQSLATNTREALATMFRTGADHALITEAHPIAAGALPTTVASGLRHVIVTPAILRRIPARQICSLGALAIDGLEWCRLRGTWLRGFRRLEQLAYSCGYARAGGSGYPERGETELELDVAASDPIPKPAVAPPLVHVHVGPRRIASFRPHGGQWGRMTAEEAIAQLDPEGWRMLTRLRHAQDASGLDATNPRLEGTAILFGPANRTGDDRHAPELIAAGARVARATGRVGEHWASLARLIDETPEPYVALTLPGVRGDAVWLATAMVPFAGVRVAGVFGVGIPRGCAPLPTLLASRTTARGLHHTLAVAPQFAVLATDRLAQVGGLDPRTARFGVHGPLLDLIERFADAGFVVAHQETPGIDPPGSVRPERSRLAWSGAWASGGLVARTAVEHGPARASALLLARLGVEPALQLGSALKFGEPSVRFLAGTSLARLAGCVSALANASRWRGPTPSPPATAPDEPFDALSLAGRQ